jgi:hypothetical protein
MRSRETPDIDIENYVASQMTQPHFRLGLSPSPVPDWVCCLDDPYSCRRLREPRHWCPNILPIARKPM